METRRQLLSFVAVGVASNAVLYLAYLALTGLGVGHKTAMTLLFAIGVLWTYLLNRGWTFRHDGAMLGSALRYFGTYLLAYFGNVVALLLFVDMAHFPHRIVMLVLIAATACLTFLLQKFWVFSSTRAFAVDRTETSS